MMNKKQLSPREQRTLLAAAACLLPPGGAFPYGYEDVDLKGFADDYLAVVPRDVRMLLHFILWFLEYLGFLFAGRVWRFSTLSLEARERALDRMRSSRMFFLRGFYILLTTVVTIPFYRDPRVLDAIGYAGYKPGVNKLQSEEA